MKIKINNIGHVDKAEIDVDSITVIAGNNNTGKSTVGKVLYATATGLNLLDECKVLTEKGEVIADKIDTFSRIIELEDEEEAFLEKIKDYCQYAEFLEEFSDQSCKEIDQLFSNKVTKDISKVVNQIINRVSSNKKSIVNMVKKDLLVYLNKSINDKNYKINIMQKVFDDVFLKQITSLFDTEKESFISVKELNQNEIKLGFCNQQLVFENTDLELDRPFAKAIYIDNPFILDSPPRRIFIKKKSYSYRDLLKAFIFNRRNLTSSNLFELDIREKQIEEIFRYVMKEGRISFKEGLNYIMNDEVQTPLFIQNLSTGLKSFSIMELLLRSDILSKLEYLILDEPEIHLHPEWQLKYAELIVLISKHFNIKVIITSHSPYFIEAIELFSKKHMYSADVKFYRTIGSKENQGYYTIEDVSLNVKKLYKDLASAFYELENLRVELKFGGVEGSENR